MSKVWDLARQELISCPLFWAPSAVVVFNLTKQGNVLRAILGDADIGTSIGSSVAAEAAAPAKEGAPELSA